MRRELELTPMRWVQEKAYLRERETMAREYSEICKRNTFRAKFRRFEAKHMDAMYMLSGFSVFALLTVLYFVGIIL